MLNEIQALANAIRRDIKRRVIAVEVGPAVMRELERETGEKAIRITADTRGLVEGGLNIIERAGAFAGDIRFEAVLVESGNG